jgi:signal transduction histidine kinase/ActR/RegA family two-component response regulator
MGRDPTVGGWEGRLLSSLRIRLLVLVLVAAVPIVGIVVLSAREQRRLLVAEASLDVHAVSQLVAERHQRSVDAARGLLFGLSRMPEIAALDGARCSAALAPLLASERVFVNIAAARADGQLFCSAAPVAKLPVDLSDRAFFQNALRTGGLGVGELVLSRVVGKGAIGFGYPVRDAGGKTVAVAIVSLAVEELQHQLEELPLPEGVEVAVLDRRGVAISVRPDPVRWLGKPFDSTLITAVESERGPVALQGTDDVVRLYSHREVAAPDGTVAMHVIAGIPTAAILEPVNRVSTKALLASLLTSALALAAAVLMAELTLVRRVRRVAATARRIARGDLSARTGLPGRADELGELVTAFDDMARALEALDREKRRSEEELRQAHKLEAIGQLAGGVAHDFNNLLTVILSAASAIEEQLPASHPSREDAREVAHAAERAAALTRQLLAFSRRQALAPRVMDVAASVRGMERMLQRVLGEGIRLSVCIRAEARVFADPGQIELALLNLSVNARDAMPRGGRLDVEVDVLAVDDPGLPEGGDVPAGPLAALTVRDSGVGIDPEVRSRIFEPFFTTKGPGRGTGLGLSTVLGIVGQSGGAVRVRSEKGRGSEFTIYLPVHAGGAERAADTPSGTPLGRDETILVVEDDTHLRAMLRRTLYEHGYQVFEAGSAPEALAAAVVRAAPSLVLTDVILPEGNGVDLARELSGRWPGVPVVFMSGYAGDHLSGAEPLPPGARLLPKPFTPDVLLAEIREALREARRGASPRVA